MNSFSVQKKIENGQSIDRLLSDPGVIHALGEIQTKYEQAWKKTAPDQTDEREQLWMMQATLETFKQELLRMVSDGRFEELSRDREQ